jgi:ubiquinone/menaquinone biosynthesis C-methylase UbiE
MSPADILVFFPDSRFGTQQRTPALGESTETADVETSSDDYALRFSGAIGSWFLNAQEEATLRMLAPHRGDSVLDVGGGHGQLIDGLIREDYRVTVVGSSDICKTRIQRYIDENRCSFKVANLLYLPFPSKSFDIVISYRLLPHVLRWREFVGELSRVARKVVLVDYPSARSANYFTPLLFRLKKRFEGDTRPFTSFRETQLLEAFASFGFERAARYPQFFLPMVLHRMLKSPKLSSVVERACRLSGATSLLGSPVILKLVRKFE